MVERPKPKAVRAKAKAKRKSQADSAGESLANAPESSKLNLDGRRKSTGLTSEDHQASSNEGNPANESAQTDLASAQSPEQPPAAGDAMDYGPDDKMLEEELAREIAEGGDAFEGEINSSLSEVMDLLAQEVERLQVALEYYRLSDHPNKADMIRWHVQQIDVRQDRLDDIKRLMLARGDDILH